MGKLIGGSMSKALEITIISILAIVLMVVSFLVYKVLDKPSIYNGVRIQNVDVGSLSKEDAKDKVDKNLRDDLEGKEIIFTEGDFEIPVTYKDLGVKHDYEKATKEAYNVGRKGNIFKRLKQIYDVSMNDKNISLEVIKDEEKIKEITESVNKQIYRDKEDATISYTGGGFVVTDEVIGKNVDQEELQGHVSKSINGDKGEVRIPIPVEEDKPLATKELLSQVREEIGTYHTKFGLNDSNRVYNIQKASNSIDNMVVLPGESFSFNSTTGPRSLSAGYKEATVISNGEFVPGEGGGVCQVSSTLYNTIVESGLEITERHTHSLPISYVPPGRDATVAFDVLDLKFKNNYSAPIYIKSYVSGGTLTIKMYGNKNARP